ncbi:hypothetical protein TrispH2_003845 [Trichoplax sp. H2]|nr:hypothetical protein TrispH2_003845 [Trichoplax sp. H2]|eukprot:RDD44131.1 hypothetical protein TrispH2_003845 [Trichoplax sp. H2]
MKTQDYMSNENQDSKKDGNFATPAAWTSNSLRSQRKRKPLGESSENMRNQAPATARPNKTKRGPTQTPAVRHSSRLKSRTESKRPSQVPQNNFITPAAKKTIAQLSTTTATGIKSRYIRPGEICVSIHGSPVSHFSEETPVSKRQVMDNKATLVFQILQMLASRHVPEKLDEETIQELNRWKERMDHILIQTKN